MAISSIGVGSGLPLDELLTNLERTEKQSLNVLTTRSTREKTRLSAYGTIKSGIEALQKAAQTLGKAETFGALKTAGGGEFFSATSKAGAIAGQYSINVNQLATSQSLKSSQGLASRDTALASGDVNIQVELVDGTKTTLSLSAADTSLNGIVKAFNSNTNAGVSATMVNNGDPTNPYYMLFNARNTGTESAVKSITVSGVNGTDVTALNDAIGFTQGSGGALTETAAKNAELTINDIDITSQRNSVENVIEGVTLSLTKETESAQNLTLSADDSVTEKAVNAFVTAYNNLQNTIKTLTSYNTETQTGSPLTGDSLSRRVQTQMRQALSAATGSGEVRNLAQMGITTDPQTGTLKVDSSKLSDALKNNMAGVQDLFSGTKGLSKSIDDTANLFVKTGGIIPSATDGVNRSIKALEAQYASASDRIDSRMKIYRDQFQKLDVMMSQMNSTSNYLNQQLSAIANMNSSSSNK